MNKTIYCRQNKLGICRINFESCLKNIESKQWVEKQNTYIVQEDQRSRYNRIK